MDQIKYLDLAGLTAYDKKLKEWIKSGLVDITDDEIRALFITVAEGPADNEIWYTSSDGNIVTPYSTSGFEANEVSNTYENGKGVITFDGPVTSIGGSAFAGCSSLKSIIIPESVTSIGAGVFRGCSSLTSVTIPNSVTSIGLQAFNGCSSLVKTNYTGDIAGWCNIKFSNYDANPMCYSHNFYINDQEIKDLVIQNTTNTIQIYAFYNCSSLTSVTIPESVTSINANAFYNCLSLTSVTIGESVDGIGDSAFTYCSSLTSVTIPNSVKRIGNSVFRGCSSLSSVTIGKSVTSIGKNAFSDCSSLISITCEAVEPPTLGPKNNLANVTAVYVPAESVDAYKAASSWSYYASKIQPIQ